MAIGSCNTYLVQEEAVAVGELVVFLQSSVDHPVELHQALILPEIVVWLAHDAVRTMWSFRWSSDYQSKYYYTERSARRPLPLLLCDLGVLSSNRGDAVVQHLHLTFAMIALRSVASCMVGVRDRVSIRLVCGLHDSCHHCFSHPADV